MLKLSTLLKSNYGSVRSNWNAAMMYILMQKQKDVKKTNRTTEGSAGWLVSTWVTGLNFAWLNLKYTTFIQDILWYNSYNFIFLFTS